MDLFEAKFYVGIVGTRRRDTEDDFDAVLKAFSDATSRILLDDIVIVSGGCPHGGDRFAEIIAERLSLEKIIHYPDRNKFLGTPQPYRSTKQNYERNSLVARDSRDCLIACVAPDRKGGTEDTIAKYRAFHKKEPVIV